MLPAQTPVGRYRVLSIYPAPTLAVRRPISIAGVAAARNGIMGMHDATGAFLPVSARTRAWERTGKRPGIDVTF